MSVGRMMRFFPLVCAFALVGCPANEDTGPAQVQYAGPTLEHEPAASATSGAVLPLSVTAADPEGVAAVQLYYRTVGGPVWTPAALTNGGDAYAGEIPAEAVIAPGVEYYFEASDLGDPPATSKLPEAGSHDPFVVTVPVVGNAFPFNEDFELTDSETSLSALGWANASQGFTGYSWDLSTRYIRGGTYSVSHARGADGIDTIVDWLISPAIDLTSAPDAQVTWYELGITPDAGNHGLYVSTGGRNPTDGDYVAVKAALPAATSGAFERSAAYDLTAFAGNVVYLAWRFEGADSDDWYIDDVSVAARTADLSATLSAAPAEIHPGESGVLTVSVSNAAVVDAADVTVFATFPDGGAVFSAASADLGPIAGGAAASGDLAFTIDADTADNRYLPVEVTLTSEAGAVTATGNVLVGFASTASLTWNGLSAGSLLVEVGVGDPDAPDWSTTLYSGAADAGETTFTADITDAYAYLPPAVGDDRWWARVDTAVSGQVTDFNLSYGGSDYAAAAVPEAVTSDDIAFVYVPTPAEPAINTYSSDPADLDPGASSVSISFSIVNNGQASSGPLYASLVSTSADLSVSSGGPVLVDPDVFEADEMALVTSAFTVDVSPAHTDSSPVTADLVLDDGYESWTLPLSFDVPFPVLAITRVEVDDDSRDAILGPDESADLSFRITNRGDESASGLVSASLTATTTGSASLLVDDNVESLGTMSVGATDVVGDFNIEAVGGTSGDELDLLLTLTDAGRTYESHYAMTLGEAPWQSIADLDDAIGDSVGEDQPDIINGTYRVVADVLQVRVAFSGTPDLSTLFITAWGLATSADYDLYEIGAQSGVGSLRGYSYSTSSFYDLEPPVITTPDANTVQIDLPIATLGLTFDEFTLGFGAGWCGDPEYYCDHFPDDWGYPYVSMDITNWYTMAW